MPTLADVRARFVPPEDDPPYLETCTLDGAAPGSEGEKVLRYLETLGFQPKTNSDIFHHIRALEDEEELSAFQCQEGVAVTHASDGWWLLFVEDDA
ncbi:MAG: hypothetical protein K2Y04_14285 [Caulobacteraceae bacterium]|nr:hypothetical protein [Caulobacteraceae bacterium]